MNTITAYKTESIDDDATNIQFLFESEGVRPIVKAIEYSFVKKLSGRRVYNLGFGDYDEENGSIIDDVNSNNGDMRKVLSTVLNTVPKFFAKHKDCAIVVQGSDSAEDFKIKCEVECKKNCNEECKNFNRRITVYKYFVDRNFVELSKEYIFFGFTNWDNPDLTQYVPGNECTGLLVYMKK